MAIADLAPDPGLELVRAQEPTLPPGWIPVEAVYNAVSSYRAGDSSPEDLVDVVDEHGEDLEATIAARALETYTEFVAGVQRLGALHNELSTRLAQWAWIQHFPDASEEDVQLRELTVSGARGAEIPVSVLLDALARLDLEDEQLIARGRPALAARLERLLGADDAAIILALLPAALCGCAATRSDTHSPPR